MNISGTRARIRKGVGIVAATALLLGAGAGVALADEPTASITISKAAGAPTALAGDEVIYTLTLSNCGSGSGEGCKDIVVTDQLPTGVQWVGWVGSGPVPDLVTVTAPSESSNTLTLSFNGVFPAGFSQDFQYTVKIDPTAAVGTTLSNTATVAGSNVAERSDTATITVVDDPTGKVSLDKAWTPASGLAGSTAGSTVTLTATNSGNRAAQSLTITEPAAGKPNPFEYMDLTGIGVQLPAGATGASVTLQPSGATYQLASACTVPGGSGPGMCLDPGAISAAELAATTSLSITFAGTVAPNSPATAYLGVQQRTTLRTGGTTVPAAGTTVTNEASVTASYADGVTCRAQCADSATASYQEVSAIPSLKVTKSGYTPATVLYGSTQTITNVITATNNTAGGIRSMTLDDNGSSATGPLRDGSLTLNALSWEAPAGTAATSVTVYLRGAGSPTTLNLEPATGGTASGWTLPGPYTLADVGGYTFTFTSADGSELPQGAAAKITMNTQVNWANIASGAQSVAANTATGTLSSSVTDAATTGTTKANSTKLSITNPKYSTKVSKTARDDFVFDRLITHVQYTVAGSVADSPVSSLTLQDPVDPAGDKASNPFNQLDLRQLVSVTVPENTTLTAFYWDGTEWVKDLAIGELAAGTHGNVDFSTAAQTTGTGVRFVLTATSGSTIAKGVSLAVTFDTTLRDTTRNGDAIVRTTDKVGSISYTQRAALPANCASSTLALDGQDNATAATSGDACPVVQFFPEAAGYALIMHLLNYWPDMPEQADPADTPTPTPNSQTDAYAFSHVQAAFTNPEGTTAFTVKSYSSDWAQALDLVSVGGDVYVPDGSGYKSAGKLRLIEGESATVTWLDESGAELGTPTQVPGTGSARADGTPFSEPVPEDLRGTVAGYKVTFATTDAAGFPADFFTQFTSTGLAFPKILVAQQHVLRAYARDTAAATSTGWPGAVRVPTSLPAPAGAILAEGNYLSSIGTIKALADYYSLVSTGCIAANGTGGGDMSPYPHTSTRVELNDDGDAYVPADNQGKTTRTGLCGSIPLQVRGKATYHDDEGPQTATDSTWSNAEPISMSAAGAYSYARLVDEDVTVSQTASLRRVVNPTTGATDTGAVQVPVAGATPSTGYPLAMLAGTTTYSKGTKLDQLVATIGATVVPDAGKALYDTVLPGIDTGAQLFDYFVPVSLDALTVTPAKDNATSLKAVVYFRGGTSQEVTGDAVAADLTDLFSREEGAFVTGVQFVVTPEAGVAGVAQGTKVDFALRLQLRDTVYDTSTSIQEALINARGSLTVGDGNVTRVTASGTDPVANHHSQVPVTVELQQGARGVGLAASFVPATGALDTHPATDLKVRAANNGVTDEKSLTIDLRSRPQGAASQLWNSFDLVGEPAITPPLYLGAVQTPTAVATVYFADGTTGDPVPLDCSSGTCTGTWPGDLSSIRGLVVTFSAGDAMITPSLLDTDAATVTLPLQLRDQLLNPAGDDWLPAPGGTRTTPAYDVPIVANVNAWINDGATDLAAPPASPTFTPTYSHPKVAVSKLVSNGTDYVATPRTLWPSAIATYAIVVDNVGEQGLTPVIVTDTAPAGYLLQPGSTVQVSDDGATWVALPAQASVKLEPGADGTITWTVTGFALAPGASLRVLVSFEVGALASGPVVNQASVQVFDLNVEHLEPADYCAGTSADPLDSAALATCTASHEDTVINQGGFRIQTLSRGNATAASTYEAVSQSVDDDVPVTQLHTDTCTVAAGPDTGYTTYPCAALSDVGAAVDYRIRIANYTTTPTARLVVGDLLPAVGDHLLTNSGSVFARGSEFAGQTLLGTPVVNLYDLGGTVIASTGGAGGGGSLDATFWYCPGATCDLEDPASWTPLPAIDAGSPLTVGQLRAELSFGAQGFTLGQTVRLDFSVATPTATEVMSTTDTTTFSGLSATPDGALSSWNTAAFIAYNKDDGSLTHGAEESAKAGVVLRVAQLDVTATLINNTRAADALLGGWTVRVHDETADTDVRSLAFTTTAAAGSLPMATDAGGVGAAWFTDNTPQAWMWVIPGHAYTLELTDSAGASWTWHAQTAEPKAVWELESMKRNWLGVTYIYQPGTLTVAKTVAGQAAPDPGLAYPFTASCTYKGEELLQAAETDFTLGDGQDITLDRLPLGARCTVRETSAGIGASTTPADVVSQAGWSTDITQDSATQRLDVVNSYSARTLVVRKAVELPAGFPTTDLGQFTLEVSCTSAQTPSASFTRTLTLQQAGSQVFADLPADAECSAREVGHGYAAKWATAGGAGVSIAGQVAQADFTAAGPDTREVTVTNTFTTQPLSLTKQVTGDAPVDGQWDFGAACMWNGQWISAGAQGLLAGQTWTWDIPTGAVCALAEPDAGGATSTTWSGAGVTDGANPPTGVSLAQPASVTAVNHFPDAVRPVLPNTGGNGAGGGASTPLPFTGANAAAQLGLVALLLAAGAALWVLGLRRQRTSPRPVR